jgi:hypothetical protein
MGVQMIPSQVVRLRLKQALLEALQEIGGRIEDSIAAKISDAYPPASVPGEQPHRRTGALRAGLSHSADYTDHGAQVTIYVVRDGADPLIPVHLEFGTKFMAARPFMQPARDEWAGLLSSILPQVYREKLGNVGR